MPSMLTSTVAPSFMEPTPSDVPQAMKASGALFVLLPNALAAKIGDGHAYPP